LVLERLEVALRVEGVDAWRGERVMRAVLGTLEDPSCVLRRVDEFECAVRVAALTPPGPVFLGDV
jgi:hypothetical protein